MVFKNQRQNCLWENVQYFIKVCSTPTFDIEPLISKSHGVYGLFA
ncbi:hypothetical protein M2140_001913 [Clostridiales Family XIII bacterium PM5-7]